MDYKEYLLFWLKLCVHKKAITKRVESFLDVDFEQFKKDGLKLIIFDVDDTLCGHGDKLSETVRAKLKLISKSFKIGILSNCNKERRDELEKLMKGVTVHIEKDRSKPGPAGFLNITKHFSVNPTQSVMIGDRLGTDMWGAHRAGIAKRILVRKYSKVFGGTKAPLYLRIVGFCENLTI